MTQHVMKETKDKLMLLQTNIEHYIQEHGFPPSFREMQKMGKFSTTSHVAYCLDQLEELGSIERIPNQSRSIRILKPILNKQNEAISAIKTTVQNLLSIPVVGPIFASQPVPMPASDFSYYDAETTVEIAESMLPVNQKKLEQLYALQVKGNSMIEDMVNDGDILIMQPAQEANNGDMVAVWLADQDETTLKRFYREKDRIRLQPANPEMQPIYIDDTRNLSIQGKVLLIVKQVGNPKFNRN